MTVPSPAPSRRRFLGATAGLGVLLGSGLLTACGGADTGSAAGGAASGKPRRGGRIRLGIIDVNQNGDLDAHKPIGNGSIIRGFALYAKPWEWNAQMQPALTLAESAEISPDARTWTVRLKQGLEFHNGKTITADDFVFSARRLTDPELASPYAGLLSYVDRDRIQKLDDRTVRFHFKNGMAFVPFPENFTNFGGIVPVDYDPRKPVGAGPYKLKEFTPGQRSLFTRFENYFRPGQPYADELEIIDFKDEQSRIAALQSGQIDLANGIAADQIRLLGSSDAVHTVVSRTNGWQGFELNLSKPPFDDEKVRTAFRLLVDRQDLVDRALSGQGRIANDLYSPQDPTFDTSLPQRPYDVARAKRLLREAGAQDLTVELVTGPDPTSESAALVFATQARKAGVTVNVKKVDSATFDGPQRTDFALSTGELLTESFLVTGLHLDAPGSNNNKTHFSDPRFTKLFNQALGEPDVAKRTPLVHEMQQIQYDKGGLIIWGFVNNVDAVAQRIGGVTAEHTQFPLWRFEKLWVAG
ncbi:ABC transporter substrate-binding protein [Streptomyces sp. NPDC005820]|uniref:ABC transporter substrate-binding protein n=1 Tax=Streptomyces sp. NPDC005820 TaxID=3157069 RepID=UPI0033CBE9F1